jgi:hypothetical protein
MKMRAPEGATSTVTTGTDGKSYALTPGADGTFDVPAAAGLAAALHGWVPVGPITLDALRAEAAPETTLEKNSGIAATGARLANAIKEAISPSRGPVNCMLCDQRIKDGEQSVDLLERDGELRFAKKTEKGEPSHSTCWKKFNDTQG